MGSVASRRRIGITALKISDPTTPCATGDFHPRVGLFAGIATATGRGVTLLT
jgi:hypothetical protein